MVYDVFTQKIRVVIDLQYLHPVTAAEGLLTDITDARTEFAHK